MASPRTSWGPSWEDMAPFAPALKSVCGRASIAVGDVSDKITPAVCSSERDTVSVSRYLLYARLARPASAAARWNAASQHHWLSLIHI